MSRTTHSISTSTRVFCWISILISAFLFVGCAWLFVRSLPGGDFSINRLSAYIILVFGIFSFSGAIFLGINILKSHIKTSIDGLEYHGVGVHLFSSWEDIENIKPSKEVGLSKINSEVVVLRKPPEILSIRWYGKLFLGKGYVPLSDFGKWRQNSLGNEIRKYAPRLLS